LADKLLIAHADGGAALTLDMPALRNPITDAGMVAQICAAMDRLNTDPLIRCAISTGASSDIFDLQGIGDECGDIPVRA
jgi:enoyl-CoA hydratase/carnithine racemase